MKYVNEEEKRWRRRSDAITLAEAEQIKADKERYSAAQIGAKEILKEEADRLKGLSKVAINPTVTKAVRKAERAEQGAKEVIQQNTKKRSYPNPATVGKLF